MAGQVWSDFRDLHRAPLPGLLAKWSPKSQGSHLHGLLVTLGRSHPQPTGHCSSVGVSSTWLSRMSPRKAGETVKGDKGLSEIRRLGDLEAIERLPVASVKARFHQPVLTRKFLTARFQCKSPSTAELLTVPTMLPSSVSSIVTLKVKVTRSCPTLCNPMDCSPPGFSAHGILQAGILEWVAIPFPRGSS